MGAETGIEWCDRTWSPWGGCQAVSDACKFCYAEALDKRTGHANRWGPHGTREERAAAYYKQPWKWNDEACRNGRTISIFPSMCDPFDNHRSIKPEWRVRFWNIVRCTPDLRWLLLTKRPQNIPHMLPADWGDGYPNVWLGCTAENQEEADRRVPHLLSVPATVRFLSCEPLLGPIDLTLLPSRWDGEDRPLMRLDALRGEHRCGPTMRAAPGRIHWVIAGGESGPHARPTHQAWARDLRDQCAGAGVPFFWKQWGEWLPGVQYTDELRVADPDEISKYRSLDWVDNDWHEADLFDTTSDETYRVGKKRAGNFLDGKQHLEFPHQP